MWMVERLKAGSGVVSRPGQTAALHAAWTRLPKDRTDVDTDGKVEPGPALDAARDALGAFYKTDEAHSFDGWIAGHDQFGEVAFGFGGGSEAG